MTQNISNSNYGSVNRIGMTENGRIVYQISDATGSKSAKISVAQKDCDVFEKSYHDIMVTAPKLEAYVKNTPPEKMEKRQKYAKWIMAGCGIGAGIWPLLKCKINNFGSGFKAVALTLLATGSGLVLGGFLGSKLVSPPGAAQFNKATQAMSKLDIQPVEG